MTDIKPANRGFYWSTLFLRSLIKQGLMHAVISPGSRSTPLTMAAAAMPQLRKHVILDERSAAFTALGIGKATNIPAALICTSGTAVANYLPAVIESRKSGIPMLLLTADRPPQLHGSGANQTINQHHIFGDYPVLFHDLGEPSLDQGSIAKLTTLGQESFNRSRDDQGPVHLNFPFKKPLEPEKRFLQTLTEENKEISVHSLGKESFLPDFKLNADIRRKFNQARKPLIIIGQLAANTNVAPIFRLAEKLSAPVLSEQKKLNPDLNIQGFEGFLRNKNNRRHLAPDLIVRFGRQPASKSLLQAIKFWPHHQHIHVADTSELSDIDGTTTVTVDWDGATFDLDKFSSSANGWLSTWNKMETIYAESSKKHINNASSLTDASIYHHLVKKIPNSWTVFISNSFPVRDHSMFGHWGTQKIYTNRGASGIDGITSTALGVNIGSDHPGILFTGDLAFLHDTNALLSHKLAKQPLVIVVINNQGGSIFRMLPVAEHKEHFGTYFETPQQTDITKLAQTYGINAQTVSSIDELKEIDLESLTSKSDSKVNVIECKTDADESMQIRNKIWAQKL